MNQNLKLFAITFFAFALALPALARRDDPGDSRPDRVDRPDRASASDDRGDAPARDTVSTTRDDTRVDRTVSGDQPVRAHRAAQSRTERAAPQREQPAGLIGRVAPNGGQNAGVQGQRVRPAANGQQARPGNNGQQSRPVENPRVRLGNDARTGNRSNQVRDNSYRRPAGVHPGTYQQNRAHLQGVPRPSPIRERDHLLSTPRAESRVAVPQRGPDGRALMSRVAGGPPAAKSMNVYMNNRLVLGQVGRYNRDENVRGRYYWHDYGGNRFCHYNDPWGYNWYGWYLGDQCFWTRYYGDRYWWYDDSFDRWCYWNDGYWWWQDPSRVDVVYVYRDKEYYPASDAADPVTQPDSATAPAPSGSASGTVFWSHDNTRAIKIYGASNDAFLYDMSATPAFAPVFLVSGATDARFTENANGRITEVMVLLGDGSYKLFYPDGQAEAR